MNNRTFSQNHWKRGKSPQFGYTWPKMSYPLIRKVCVWRGGPHQLVRPQLQMISDVQPSPWGQSQWLFQNQPEGPKWRVLPKLTRVTSLKGKANISMWGPSGKRCQNQFVMPRWKAMPKINLWNRSEKCQTKYERRTSNIHCTSQFVRPKRQAVPKLTCEA